LDCLKNQTMDVSLLSYF